MDTLQYIKDRFQLRYRVPMPIKLPIERTRGLTTLFNELGFKVGAEVGVFGGRYAEWICHVVKGVKLYAVDSWKAYPRYVEMCDEEGQRVYDDAFENAKRKLARFDVEFIRKWSMDAVHDFKDGSLDFVYIDANHTFEYVVADIAEWERKVRVGGIVAGHDYWNSIKKGKVYQIGVDRRQPSDGMERMKLCQVKDAIDAWTKTNVINPWFITQEHWRSSGPSWFYVKK